MQTKEVRIKLVNFAGRHPVADWKRRPLAWGALVLALAGTKMSGSKFYAQVKGLAGPAQTRILGDMAFQIDKSKYPDLSDVCDYWRLLYDDAITR
ncbi:hypothetical protein HX799_07675 [Pseudomonas tolaasii]|uniref:hypothetical protein n=1 Tax=Pseudomonas tolaasii TaxID=29442 RepID=UPI00159F7FCE|nr:hypothetical protein [Pseudomonas tolaasii]NWC30619.1 hypothetical protein [Pseudomonas tolaasii]NWC51039.1 hypothetical protein [Pseudomonas tolaasii]NWE62635.1 hypothetical protein [Pseudomonas tolaasii]